MLQDLGWSATDAEALCPVPATPAADAATAAKSKTPAAVKKPVSADRKASAAADAVSAPMTEELVTGFETACHVAAIRSHHAAMLQLKEALMMSVTRLKDCMYSWQRNETANKERWAGLLNSLGDLV